jgi:hypothetical protein
MHDVYMSYWSAGYQKDPNENVLLLTKIANHIANKYFRNVYLITDSRSQHLFRKMQWAGVSTDLDLLNRDLGGIWSLGKIMAYKIAAEKRRPFIHLDYDVMLWNGMPKKISNAEVFAQNQEADSDHVYEIDKLLKNCTYKSYIAQIRQNDAANMGIFGGTNTNFIYTYANSALDFANHPQNYKFWTSFTEFSYTWNMATIVEQYFMVTMSHIMSQKITYLFDNGWPTDNEAKEQSYTHFMGDKDHPRLKEKIESIAAQNNLNLHI